jgi:hypothetical protein
LEDVLVCDALEGVVEGVILVVVAGVELTVEQIEVARVVAIFEDVDMLGE